MVSPFHRWVPRGPKRGRASLEVTQQFCKLHPSVLTKQLVEWDQVWGQFPLSLRGKEVPPGPLPVPP